MERGTRKILLASTFLALPLALIAMSLATAAQPKGGFVLPGQKKQTTRQVAVNEPIANSDVNTTNRNAVRPVGSPKPGGIIQAFAKSAKSGDSNVQPTGLLDGLLGGNQQSKQQKKALANQKQNASRPAPNWDGIPFHNPTRTAGNQIAPIRDLAAPTRKAAPSLPIPKVASAPMSTQRNTVVRRSISKPIQAMPTAAKLRTSRPVISDSDRLSTSRRFGANSAIPTPAEAPLSRSTSNRRSGRQSVSPLDSSEISARSTMTNSIASDKKIENELVPKVSRRMISTPQPKPVAKPAPKKVVAKPVPTVEVVKAKVVEKVPAIVPEKKVAIAKPAPAPTTLASPISTPKPKLTPLPPAPAQKVLTLSNPVAHRSGPPESAFEPRRIDDRAVRPLAPSMAPLAPSATPLAPSMTSNVAFPIGSGVAVSADGLANGPDARIAQRPQIQTRTPQYRPQPYAADPYAARNNAPIAAANNFSSTPSAAGRYQPAAPVKRSTPTVANGMRRERDADTGQTSIASELPGIRVMTHGPREVTIRQTHQFEIHVENRGSIDAKGVMVRATIPDWADMRGQNATRGEIAPQGKKGEERLVWTIDELPAGSSERMFVRLRAERSGTHGLDVDWTLAPQKSSTQIQVHEPQLQLTIEGPSEIIFGQSQTYKVRVLNPGDGTAPNVVFTLSPNSPTPQTQRIGDIPAGKEAQFEVELTAQDLGDLKIDGLAAGDLELRADASKTIRVSAADLEAMFSGPEVKYQDTDATYALQVQNKGRAISEKVVATLQLPVGVKYLGGLDGVNQRGDMLQWNIESLPPGASRDYQFRCNMKSTGDQSFKFSCKGSAAGQADVAIVTQVESISDLVMTINDPAAPAPVGTEVEYEIVIRNRGSRAATDVRAIAQFSHGIEPRRLKGHSGEILTGQVLFDPIATIEPGQEVRLQVVAEADQAGHHRFRSEIRSGDTVLVSEEATHYMSPRKERISRRSSDTAVQTR